MGIAKKKVAKRGRNCVFNNFPEYDNSVNLNHWPRVAAIFLYKNAKLTTAPTVDDDP